MPKTLVTGGAGFIGSHLCRKLVELGNDVVCLDNFSSGRAENVAHLLTSGRFTLLDHDIVSPTEIEVDAIFNLACPASPAQYQIDPIKTLLTNVVGAANVLDLALRCNARVFQASTSEVYGDPDVHPQAESFWGKVNPIGPRACYDEGKRAAETLFFDYLRAYGLRVKVVRIFNTYGPGMRPDDGRVVCNFILQALLNRDITIYGNGEQTRSFCYVDDLVDGAIRMMGSSDDVTGPINLGNPEEYRIIDLADVIVDLTGSRSKITFRPLPTDDPRQRRPDISAAREMLGWEPRVCLTDGLERTIAAFETLLCSRKTKNEEALGPLLLAHESA